MLSKSTTTPAAPAAPAAESNLPRILLVDDHPLLRHGMRSLIESSKRYVVCGEADSAPKALDLATKLKPHLAIVDVSLKSTNGIELTKGLRAQLPETQILVLSQHDEDTYAERALKAGAKGYLMKHEAGEKVVAAIDSILAGQIFLSDRVKRRVLQRFTEGSSPKLLTPTEALSDRELEVFELLGNGYSTREIAEKLSLSVKTIETYREHLKVKLGLKSGSELMRRAIHWMKSQAA